MRTLVIADLHLGVRSAADVLGRPQALNALCSRLQGVDRLVLLGDTLELRHGPARLALAAAEPVMRALGDALGAGGEVVILAGNHDHALVAGWLDRRGRRAAPAPLSLEERVEPQHASWIAERLAGWLAPAAVELAYPGVWLRDDVYAMHGHYLDVHCELPTLEVLAARSMGRMVGPVAQRATPDDYEALLAPIYSWVHASAQRAATSRHAAGGGAAIRVWNTLEGPGRRRAPQRAALRAGFRLAVAAANRAGLAPLRPEISGPALRRAGLAAIAEAARRLGLTPAHLLFGHTHRSGMLHGDDASEWRSPAGARLHNPGCWVFETHLMGSALRAASPYWPGGVIALDEIGPPRLERLLGDVAAEVLRPARADESAS
ncbi:MAG: metallophosphoesterase [Solirubrobacteraceae bacterium]